MKTRDRILSLSLALFNAEGEAEQSAVDISNMLEISPGNLYYHFKGKDAIIGALFENFEEEMRIILKGSDDPIDSIEDAWVYLYIILEEIFDFRFFYRDLGVLLARYPHLAVRFRVLLAAKKASVERVLSDLHSAELLSIDPRLAGVLRDQILRNLTYWLTDDVVTGEHLNSAELIHKTVFQIMCLIVPYMGKAGFDALSGVIAHYENTLEA